MAIIKKIFKYFFFKTIKDFNKKTLPVIIQKNKFSEARNFLASQLQFQFLKDNEISTLLKSYNINYNFYLNSLIRLKLPLRYLLYQILNCFYLDNKKIYFPYPRELKKKILNDNNFFINQILWYFYIIIDFSKIIYFKIFFIYLNEKKKIKEIIDLKKKIIFIHLNDSTNFSEKKILKWLDQAERDYYPIFVNNLQKYNTYNSEYSTINNHNYIFLYLINIKSFLKVYIKELAKTFFEFLFFYKWKKILFYNDLIDLKIFQLIKEELSHKHLFLYTQNFHKPLWTFEANKRGIKTTMFFNGSTSNIITSEIDHEDWKGVKYSYWDDFLYWNNYHKSFLESFFTNDKKIFNKCNYLIISGEKKIKIPKRTIVLFPHDFNTSFYGFEEIMEYYYTNENLYYDFFEKIKKICVELNINICIKQKKINSWTRLEHLQYLNSISKNDNIFLCPHDTDVEDLIKKSIGTISMPSSSVPVISEQLGVKTVIVDFSKSININNDCLHGIKKIDNINELKFFLENL